MKLEYAILYSSDVERAAKFYEGLGLEVKERQGDRFVSIALENSFIGIKKADGEREVPGHQTVIIAVEDAQKMYDIFKNQGFKFYKEINKQSWGINFAILDSDQNKIEIVQR